MYEYLLQSHLSWYGLQSFHCSLPQHMVRHQMKIVLGGNQDGLRIFVGFSASGWRLFRGDELCFWSRWIWILVSYICT